MEDRIERIKELTDSIFQKLGIMPDEVKVRTRAEIRPTTATEMIEIQRRQTLWGDVKFFGEPNLFQSLNLGEPATKDILKDIGGINMNGKGFVTPDNIDKVIVRTKDGREFEGDVKRSEYMPGGYGAEGFSELTVLTLKQTKTREYGIKEVIFNNPATIVKWEDGTQTIVYCQDNVEEVVKTVDGKEVKVRKPRKADSFNPEIGLAMAIVKKHFGNMGNYNNVFRKYIPEIKAAEKIEKNTEKKAEE